MNKKDKELRAKIIDNVRRKGEGYKIKEIEKEISITIELKDILNGEKMKVEEGDTFDYLCKVKGIPAIYVLYDGQELVKVGITEDLQERLTTHNDSFISFDSYCFQFVENHMVRRMLESFIMWMYVPRHNLNEIKTKLENNFT